MQPSMFSTAPRIDGPDVLPADQIRLSLHLEKVKQLMSGGEWWTLPEIARAVGCKEQSASSRVRDLKKVKFGAHQIEKRRIADGVWQYRLVTR
jgi:hypothetical protein